MKNAKSSFCRSHLDLEWLLLIQILNYKMTSNFLHISLQDRANQMYQFSQGRNLLLKQMYTFFIKFQSYSSENNLPVIFSVFSYVQTLLSELIPPFALSQILLHMCRSVQVLGERDDNTLRLLRQSRQG